MRKITQQRERNLLLAWFHVNSYISQSLFSTCLFCIVVLQIFVQIEFHISERTTAGYQIQSF
ncbi:unnamed protein product [Paramecium octaurelia]|uniref:Uncharacterized protein n=1 Tax=Paramecium octaurelia TaxID=43137 RepID=A0A8S1WHM5_PAROT|nr:unnamed protein product [Paramecium octaurelia]